MVVEKWAFKSRRKGDAGFSRRPRTNQYAPMTRHTDERTSFLAVERQEDVLMDLFIILYIAIALIVLDIAALYWGADSRDGIDSPEWRRRQDKPMFH